MNVDGRGQLGVLRSPQHAATAGCSTWEWFKNGNVRQVMVSDSVLFQFYSLLMAFTKGLVFRY